jgi:hypothetical protein
VSRRTSRHLAALTACCIALTVAPVFAAPSAAEKETARAFMATGRDKRDTGDLPGALEAFKAADAIMHVPTTGLEVAKTQIALGQLVEGLDTLLSVARIPKAPDEPEPFTVARDEAAALVDKVTARIPTLSIVVQGMPAGMDLEVTVDGVAFPASAVKLPLRLDPGKRVVVVRAGTLTKQSKVELAEGESRTETIDLSEAKPVSAAPATTPPLPTTEDTPRPTSTLTHVGFAVGGAALIAGTVTGVISWSKTSSLKDDCRNGACPPAKHDELSSARSLATVSTIAFITAGVGVGVGLYGLFSAEAAPAKPAKTEATVRAFVGLGSVGLAGSF